MSLLFKTKLRRNLLGYYFTHPDESYYLRQLAGIIDEDAGNLWRELRRLEEEGLFRSFLKGRVKFYSLNRDYPVFEEIKKIVFKTEGAEGSLKKIVLRFKGISLAFIYGSYAKNNEKKASDIDLAVIGKFPVGELTRQIRVLESKLNREINFTSYSEEEFIEKRKKTGGFLDVVLKDRIIILKGKLDDR